ncbi:MAG: tetratricopeptide repeat protein, partial [Verrucomicrobiota bacterium JB025]|nr:tetratricopeptide repeat protein [Verrucomicrobiota bacterium JB025]
AGPVATQELAELFLRTFPESKYTNLVRRMMLSAIFYSGDYDTCIEIAKPMLDLVDPGSKEHDMCLHVLGGSYFYSGRFDLAKPLLDEHVEKYPKSDFALSAAYFQAANYSRLQQFKKAAGLLDKFLETYPKPSENVFMPFALYDRANCHYSLEENDKALEVLARLIKDFPASNVVDQAYNLRGNVYQTEEKPELSEKAFIAGLEVAEERQHKVVAGESLFSLIALIAADKEAGKEKQEELLAYSDKFWEKYADGSPYRSKVAVAQWPTYHANGRSEKGLKIMQQVIADIAKSPGATGLEELINSYTDSYLEDHTPEELKKHYYNFPDIHSDDYAALALLRVGVIGVFEDVVRKSADAKVKRDGSAMIQVLFQELKNDFKLADLSNYILVKVGDYLRTSTSTPKEALPYYNELLGREDKEHQFSALLGRADVNGGSDNKAEIDMAIADFEVVFEKSEEKAEREFAYFRIIELLMKKGDYKEAAEKCNYYLDRNTSKFSKFSAKVGLMLAESFDKRNMVGDAIAMYVKVWSAHMGNIAISAPAMTRWMRLSWDRNNPGVDGNPSDRQGAYEGGARYLELTGRFKDKMVDSDLALWKDVEELVKTYEANPNIKSLEQIKKEKEG